MRNERSAFESALSLIAEEQLTESPHPTGRELVAYQARKLAESEMGRIEDHLSLCRLCADAVLELVESTSAQPTEPVPTPLPQPPRPYRLPLAIAAMLLLALASLWAGFLWRGGPVRTNIEIAYLEPRTIGSGSEGRAPGDPSEELVVSSQARAVTLSLALAETAAFEGYSVAVQSQDDGRLVWSTSEVAPLSGGAFSVQLSPEMLPDGAYRIRLSGRNEGETIVLAEYDLSVRREGGS